MAQGLWQRNVLKIEKETEARVSFSSVLPKDVFFHLFNLGLMPESQLKRLRYFRRRGGCAPKGL